LHSPELNLLFDTGSGQTLLTNAEGLDTQLNDCQMAVISHGLYDHSGGLNTFYYAYLPSN
jgi:7,8-dihydropterin-6-yl-methyl-4-(beta-D-ribofuranosyl)aminobenzene 5'-phosphate synthase